MGEAFRLGGWGMYPTAVVGLIAIAAAIRYARRPERIRLALVRQLSVLTALVATLGFVSGVIHCFTAAGNADPADLQRFVVIGSGESLVNVGFGLVLLVIAWTTTALGTFRTASPGKPELHAP